MSKIHIIDDKGSSYRQPVKNLRCIRKRPFEQDSSVTEESVNDHSLQRDGEQSDDYDWQKIATTLKSKLQQLPNDDIVKKTWQNIFAKQPKTTAIKMKGWKPWPGPFEFAMEMLIQNHDITFDVGQKFIDLLHSLKLVNFNLQEYNLPKSINQCLYLKNKTPTIPLSM